ncbi:36190_t:CDS:1, partial [Gigaspora margarita]
MTILSCNINLGFYSNIEYYLTLFELIEEKENEDNYSKLCRVNDFEAMVKERELKRLDIAK